MRRQDEEQLHTPAVPEDEAFTLNTARVGVSLPR